MVLVGGFAGCRDVGQVQLGLLGDCNRMRPSQDECLMTGLHSSPGILPAFACVLLFRSPSVSSGPPPGLGSTLRPPNIL